MLFVIRDDIWESLSDDDREILIKAAEKAQQKDREMIRSQTEDFIGKLEEEGMNITRPDLEAFKEATAPAFDYFKDVYDPELLKAVQ